jgi:dimethlysulfoniopropionate lyase
MQQRPSEIQVFLDRLEEAIANGVAPASPAARAAEKIFAALKTPGTKGDASPVALPVCSQVGQAVAALRGRRSPAAKLAEALEQLAPSLVWSRRPGAEAVGADFAAGHANAVIAGNSGIERRQDLRIGISVMAPNVQYPDHCHPPEEVYVVLSPGSWRQGEAPWFEPGVGGIVYNPPDILHAMKSGAAPLLAVWCLWEGE